MGEKDVIFLILYIFCSLHSLTKDTLSGSSVCFMYYMDVCISIVVLICCADLVLCPIIWQDVMYVCNAGPYNKTF